MPDLTAGCGDIAPHTPCMYGRSSNPFSKTLCVHTMLCGAATLKSAVTYAFGYGMPAELAERLSALVLSLVAVSIVVHGVSVTPVMERYRAEA